MTVVDWMRRDLESLTAYPPPPTIDQLERQLGRRVVKLDHNENPYGPSPLVREALAQSCVERYPDAGSTVLREMLGEYVGVDPRRIICSAGGDEMLDLLMRLFLEPDDEVIDCTPAFSMYPLVTITNRGKYVPVPRNPRDFAVDVEAVEAAITPRTKAIFLCNPNNPTGNPTPSADIVRLLELGRILVLDEAYAEFAGFTLVDLTEQYSNLIVLRTMSKWAALAGVRLGYAVVDPLVTNEMTRIKSPYNVNIAAQAAGIASLQDQDYLMSNVQLIVVERERLYETLKLLPYGQVYPSETNFLYWKTDGLEARAMKQALAERGVLVRAFTDPCQALRFSVGLPDESDRLVAALEEVHSELVHHADEVLL